MTRCQVSVSGPYVPLVLCAIFLHDCTSAVTFQYHKAVVGGPASPAMAVPLFLPEMVLAGPHFWPNIFFAGPFSHVSSRPS